MLRLHMEHEKGLGFFQGASRALSIVLAAFVLSVVYTRVAPPAPSLGNLLAVSKLLAQLLLFGASVLVGLRLLARFPSRYLFLVASTLGVVFYHFGRFEPWGLFWTSFFAVVPATLLGGSLRMQGRRARIGTALGGGGLVFALVYFLRSGSPAPLPVNAALEAGAPFEIIALESPRKRGPYGVDRLTYGSGADRHRREFGADVDVRTEPVDGTKLIEGWEGRSGWARTQYWGFDASSLPLQGRVFLPRGNGPFPLVLVVHGNHAMEDFSDTGYAYLGELLASRGVVMVSVDENFINSSFSGRLDELYGRGLRTENDARGWLLLKHLEQWRRWNDNGDDGNPFFGKADMERIGLIGHSRGGEAVAVAAFFNRLQRYPDDASLRFDFGFGIRGVAAIAPVDGQYEPAGRGTPIRNTNYFVLHGSNDGDVQSFAGSRQLERVLFDDGAFHFKSSLYVAGANHGQFNTSWGRSDASFPSKNVLNLTPIMPEEDQRAIAQTFLSAFFAIVLEDEARYLPLFRDWRSGRAWLPETVLLTHYRDSTERVIADFDEDLDVTTTSLPGGSLRGEGLVTWKERLVELKYGDKGTNAVRLGWGEEDAEGTESAGNEGAADSAPSYVVSLPESLGLGTDDTIVFALADARDEPGAPIDLTLELTDGHSRASTPLSRLAPVQPRIRVQVAKSAWFNATPTSEPVYQSYAFPLAALQGIDPGRLREIRFVFDRTEKGEILLDDLGIRPGRRVDPAAGAE